VVVVSIVGGMAGSDVDVVEGGWNIGGLRTLALISAGRSTIAVT